MSVQVKICGVRSPEAVDAAVRGGARFVGLVFYPPSPRAVSVDLAAELAKRVPTGVRLVGLFVDPGEAELDHVLSMIPLDMVQLHGEETPGRVAEIKANYSAEAIKALKIGGREDLAAIAGYQEVCDWLLFDARPPAKVAALPGGNALSFDWRLLAGQEIARPWMLAGGLNAGNLSEAVRLSGARAVDVSSGVEDRPGHKSTHKIAEFLELARRL